MLRFLMTAFFAIALAPAAAQAQPAFCAQSFIIEADRPILGVPAGNPFLGRSCGDVERERVALYVDRLASISELSFSEWNNWKATRSRLAALINKAHADVAAAQSEQQALAKWNLMEGLGEVGLALAGCRKVASSPSRIKIAACVGGLVLSAAQAIDDAKTPLEMSAAIKDLERELGRLEASWQANEAERNKGLDALQRHYVQQYETMCMVVREQCR